VALAGLNVRSAVACATLLASLPLARAADPMQDRVEISRARDRWLVDVYHVRGIGSIRLKMPESAWPETVRVRLHGFPELERFSAMSTTAAFECALARPEGQHPIQTCRLGEARVDALSREPDYFEVALPREVFPTDGDGIEIRWVDQWR
jgi:hypothetical protein